MDFGALDFGLENNTTNNNNNNSGYASLDPNNPKWFGSLGGVLKQEKPVSVSVSVSGTTAAQNGGEWRDMKMAKMSQDDFSKASTQQQRSNSASSVFYDSQNMLSFSSPTLPYCARNTTTSGYGMRGVIGGVRGPFTPSQWMELEHQALIYKYITLNAQIPSNLLIPIRKALESAAYHHHLLPNPNRHTTTAACYGWGGFHLGFSNNSDPEPGRCRRTDGKKWRCSRDAVPDQKYCERHMNRGRHRSRKPVEGQSGHSVTNGPTTAATATPPPKVSPSAAVLTTTHLPYSQDNRNFLNNKGVVTIGSEKIQETTPLSILSASSVGLKQTPLSASVMPQSEFGLVCSDSLLNPLHKTGNTSQKSQNSLRQFMDDRTQLSISIPMGSASSSDLMSSTTSSPISERLNLSPLRMGLGVGNTTNTNTQTNVLSERSSWIPVSWETSMGGPLGEVLNHSTNNSPSALNLMTDGWESGQNMTLSPTGVLQKTAFGSLSNSSAGSSPRTDNNLLGSTLIASSLPLL